MNKLALILVLCPLGVNALAAESPLAGIFKNTKAKAQFSLDGETIDGNMNTSRILTTKMKIKATHKFTNDLKFNFDGGFKLQAGTYDRKSNISSGPEPTNRLQLSESNLDYTLYNTLNLVGGAISQKRFASPILLGKTAFLGGFEQVQWNSKNKKYHISFFAEQAYASNKDLSSTLPDYYDGAGHSYKAEDHLPKFFTEGLQMYYHGKKIQFHIWGGHWAYDKLGRGIAAESVHLGNTARSISPVVGDIDFKYKFKGWNGAMYFEFPFIASSRLNLSGEFVINDDGPSSGNKGYGVSSTLIIPFKKLRWDTYIRYLDIDPDTSVAYFSGVDNNRKIYNVGMNFTNPNSNLFFGIEAIHSDLKEKNPYMSDENKFSFILGTSVNLL